MADVPLLDEAAELLGVDDSEQRAARRALRREQRLEAKYAAEVLEITGIADLGMVDAETLASWNRDNGPALTTAERAEADRTWAYGHVIVDEAQELSAMAWRMVLRRIPARSMTVVGDVAQTGSPAGATSWKSMLDPLRPRPLARGAADRQLPDPDGDHDGRGGRAGLGRARTSARRSRSAPRASRPAPSASRPVTSLPRPSPGSPGTTWPRSAAPTADGWP